MCTCYLTGDGLLHPGFQLRVHLLCPVTAAVCIAAIIGYTAALRLNWRIGGNQIIKRFAVKVTFVIAAAIDAEHGYFKVFGLPGISATACCQ